MGEALRVALEGLEHFNAHNEAGLRASYADDAVLESPDGRFEGADAVTAYAMAWLNAFPDARINVHDSFGTDEWATMIFTFEGTHTETLHGPDGDLPATNRSLNGRGAQTTRVKDGKVVEEHLYFDRMQIAEQLGLLPEPATAA